MRTRARDKGSTCPTCGGIATRVVLRKTSVKDSGLVEVWSCHGCAVNERKAREAAPTVA